MSSKLVGVFLIVLVGAVALAVLFSQTADDYYKTVSSRFASDGSLTVVLAKGTRCVVTASSVTGGFGDSAILRVKIENLQTGATFAAINHELMQNSGREIELTGAGIAVVHPCQPRVDERDSNMWPVMELLKSQRP